MNAPHSGQSSQLVFDASDGNAQFLATVARSALVQASGPRSAQSFQSACCSPQWTIFATRFYVNARNAVLRAANEIAVSQPIGA